MFNAVRNSLFFFMLAMGLIAMSVVIYMGDIMVPRVFSSVSTVLNATDSVGNTDASITPILDMYTQSRSLFVDGCLYFAVILIAACILSSLLSANTITSYMINGFISIVFIAVFFYITNYVFAYLFAAMTGTIVIDGVTFTFIVYPTWLSNNFANILVAFLIAELLAVIIRPQQIAYGGAFT